MVWGLSLRSIRPAAKSLYRSIFLNDNILHCILRAQPISEAPAGGATYPNSREQKLNRMFESNCFTTGSATISNLQQAVQEVKEHRALLEEADREFQVPKATLFDRVKERMSEKSGWPTVLSEMKKCLLERLIELLFCLH
jgi:hypothetical protein